MNRNIWFGKSKMTEKPWGYEVNIGGIFHGKHIFMRKNHRTSLKFNKQKNEMLYVVEGGVQVEYAAERHFEDPVQHPAMTRTLSAGEFMNIQAGCPYRLTALSDSTVFELSDRKSGYNRVIIEDDYGRETDGEEVEWIFNPPIVE